MRCRAAQWHVTTPRDCIPTTPHRVPPTEMSWGCSLAVALPPGDYPTSNVVTTALWSLAHELPAGLVADGQPRYSVSESTMSSAFDAA